MSNKWMRFCYTDPIPLINDMTGKKTGKSIVYLRAVRSDCYLYQVHAEISDYDLLIDGALQSMRVELRKTLDGFIDDVPDVAPMRSNEAYKGIENWTEALVH